MNICFIIGKIISKIEFDFVIGDNKNFKNIKISIVRFGLKLLDKNIVTRVFSMDNFDNFYKVIDGDDSIGSIISK